MTIAATKAAIKRINPALTVKFSREWGEWRVSFSIPAIQLANGCDYATAKERNEMVAYYTTDADDAVATAKAMWARYVDTAKI